MPDLTSSPANTSIGLGRMRVVFSPKVEITQLADRVAHTEPESE